MSEVGSGVGNLFPQLSMFSSLVQQLPSQDPDILVNQTTHVEERSSFPTSSNQYMQGASRAELDQSGGNPGD